MKRHLLLFAISLSMATISFSQSKKYVLFEHFTQASCGPCAVQNPAFEAVRAQNLGSTHHLAYHTSWPGTDPMNALNPTEVQTRVTYYGVTGVPSMHFGKTWDGGPGSVSDALICDGSFDSAPLRIKSTDVRNEDGSHEVTVTMLETGDIAGDNLKLRVAVVEHLIEYTSAPGSNGERDFPNVFRDMLTGSGGQTYLPSGDGTEQSFTFNYTENAAYKPEELYILAWLQDGDGTIVNSGASSDPAWQFINLAEAKTVEGDGPHTFTSKYKSDEATEKFKIELSSNAPEAWTASINVNGNAVMSGDDVEINSTDADIELSVTPQEKGGIVTYTMSITSLENPEDPISTVSYTIISGVTDVILDHGGVASLWNNSYESGLESAGNTGFGVLPLTSLTEVYEAGYLSGVNNIYNNIGWTFPSFTNSEIEVLSQFLDDGGNLFVSGQDIGWDTWDPSTAANGTVETKAFYTDYLRSEYLGDGNAANNLLTWTDDVVFEDQGQSAIVDIHGGNIYPDELRPIEPAVSIFDYNNNAAKSGAIRVEENGHKIVYVGVDMGMIADEAVRHALIQISHDWFAGIISGTEYDQLIKEALGQSYPNPAANFTTVPFTNLEKDASILVTDVSGKVLHTGNVKTGDSSYDLDLTNFTSGTYFYHLKTEDGQSVPQKLSVVK